MYYLICYDQTNQRWVAVPSSWSVVQQRICKELIFGLAPWKENECNPSEVRIPSDPSNCTLARIEKTDEFLDYGMVVTVLKTK